MFFFLRSSNVFKMSVWVFWSYMSDFSHYPSTGNLSSCFFYSEEVISLCSYSFWRRSNNFLSSCRVTVTDLGGINIFLIYSFAAVRFVMSTLFIKKGTFNHCGRSNVWNSTHHGRYVFQTTHTHTRTRTHTHTYTHTYTHTCTCTCVSLFFFVVWCRWEWGGVGLGLGVRWCGVVVCGVNGAKVAEQIV